MQKKISRFLSSSNTLAITFIFLNTVYFIAINFLQYFKFSYKDMDLAVHAQIMWNLIHGSMHSSILGVNFLGHHAHFISLLLAPIYYVFPSPLTLITLQAMALSWAVYPIYLLAKEEIGKTWALLIVIAYFLYPALFYTNYYEFHPTVFATLFLSYMVYFFVKRDFRGFVIFMVLALLCQENIPFLVGPLGIYALISKRGRRWALVPLILSMAWFALTVGFMIPLLNQNTIKFISIYSHLGNTLPDIMRSLCFHPLKTWGAITTEHNLIYFYDLFGPLAFLPVMDYRILLLIPTLLQHLLSLRRSEHVIYFHYAAEMIPLIFFAFIYGVKRSWTLNILKASRQLRFFIIVFLTFVAANALLPHQVEILSLIKNLCSIPFDFEKQKFILKIPKNSGIVATFDFLPKLSQRSKLYSFHHVVQGTYTLSDKPYELPEDTEYALLDFNDAKTFRDFYKRNFSELNLQKFITKWAIVEATESIVLFKKDHESKFPLYEEVGALPLRAKRIGAVFNGELELLGYTMAYEEAVPRKIRLSFFWKADKPSSKNYANRIEIFDKQGNLKHITSKPICYHIYPTYLWKAGQIFQENYWLLLPPSLDPSDSIYLTTFEEDTDLIAKITSQHHSQNRIRLRLTNLQNEFGNHLPHLPLP